jgi:hypothetical protein
MKIRDGFTYFPFGAGTPLSGEGLGVPLTGVFEGLGDGPGAGLGDGLSAGICALTLLPSTSLSTPVITTTSPGLNPEVISELSPSVVPTPIVRTVTVESGFTTYT